METESTPTPKTIRRRLIIDVEYEVFSDDDIREVDRRLADLPRQAAADGNFTGDSNATVESWEHTLQDLTTPSQDLLFLVRMTANDTRLDREQRRDAMRVAIAEATAQLAHSGECAPTTFTMSFTSSINADVTLDGRHFSLSLSPTIRIKPRDGEGVHKRCLANIVLRRALEFGYGLMQGEAAVSEHYALDEGALWQTVDERMLDKLERKFD